MCILCVRVCTVCMHCVCMVIVCILYCRPVLIAKSLPYPHASCRTTIKCIGFCCLKELLASDPLLLDHNYMQLSGRNNSKRQTQQTTSSWHPPILRVQVCACGDTKKRPPAWSLLPILLSWRLCLMLPLKNKQTKIVTRGWVLLFCVLAFNI